MANEAEKRRKGYKRRIHTDNKEAKKKKQEGWGGGRTRRRSLLYGKEVEAGDTEEEVLTPYVLCCSLARRYRGRSVNSLCTMLQFGQEIQRKKC